MSSPWLDRMTLSFTCLVVISSSAAATKFLLGSKDCIPPADFWLPQEDAILCAVVHEYGPNWSLVSETLYGMSGGGSYRGRYRHPVHCCERFGELFQKYVLLSLDNANHEKINSPGSGKALLKVTEVKDPFFRDLNFAFLGFFLDLGFESPGV